MIAHPGAPSEITDATVDQTGVPMPKGHPDIWPHPVFTFTSEDDAMDYGGHLALGLPYGYFVTVYRLGVNAGPDLSGAGDGVVEILRDTVNDWIQHISTIAAPVPDDDDGGFLDGLDEPDMGGAGDDHPDDSDRDPDTGIPYGDLG